MFTVTTSDGTPATLDPARFSRLSNTIRSLVQEANGTSTDLGPVPISAPIFDVIRRYVDHYVLPRGDDAEDEWEVADPDKDWDAALFAEGTTGEGLDRVAHLDLLQAANFLDIQRLLLLTRDAILDRFILGKTPDQLRAIWPGIRPFTEEEAAEADRDVGWA